LEKRKSAAKLKRNLMVQKSARKKNHFCVGFEMLLFRVCLLRKKKKTAGSGGAKLRYRDVSIKKIGECGAPLRHAGLAVGLKPILR